MANICIFVPDAPEIVLKKLETGFLKTYLFGRFFSGEIKNNGFIIRDKLAYFWNAPPSWLWLSQASWNIVQTMYSHTAYGTIHSSSTGSKIEVKLKTDLTICSPLICLILAFIVLIFQPNYKTIILFVIPCLIIPFGLKYYMEARIKKFLQYLLE